MLEPGGSGGALQDDTNASMGWFIYRPERRQTIPEEVIANEAWDRMSRLLDHKVPVSVSIDIATQFGDEHAQGYDTIAEIPGTDPKLKDQVVMVGAISIVGSQARARPITVREPSSPWRPCVY